MKTHPLTAHAREVLTAILRSPVPRQEINPDVADRLLRGKLVESVNLPSPYKTRPGNVEHLQITTNGEAELRPEEPEATETRAVSFTIDNCLDCPHSKEIRDPSSGDSFDFHDVSLCCALTPPNSTRAKTDLGETIPGRFIVMCERHIKRQDSKVPDWCPLLKKIGRPQADLDPVKVKAALKGRSQREAAKALGVPEATLRGWITRQKK